MIYNIVLGLQMAITGLGYEESYVDVEMILVGETFQVGNSVVMYRPTSLIDFLNAFSVDATR